MSADGRSCWHGAIHVHQRYPASWYQLVNCGDKNDTQELCLLNLDCACKMEDFTPVKRSDNLGCMAVDGLRVLIAREGSQKPDDDKFCARFELESIIYLFLFRLHGHLPKEVEEIVRFDLASDLAESTCRLERMVKQGLDFADILAEMDTHNF